jgi:lysophospholipase L1-like esterase
MQSLVLAFLALQSGDLIHSMDDLKVRLPKEKVSAEVVEGKVGKALRIRFEAGASGAFVMTPIQGAPSWDQAAGFSFWVKGDGSKGFGALQFIWNEDYAVRYDVAFPVDSTEWRKIVVAWRDLVPAMPPPQARFLDPRTGNPPSKLSALWFGKWWYWRDYPAHGYAIDELRLEPSIPLDTDPYLPAGAPLARVQAKIKAGRPVTIVTMGDSLTDYRHWANKPVNWPGLLAKKLKEAHRVDATVVNPAIGGTELRQNLVLIPRWIAEAPEPDLVTICFGANDWNSGMRGAMFEESMREAVDRVRRATKGKADVLVLTTVPSVELWTERAELGEACRKAATARRGGLADLERTFHALGKEDPASLFCSDKVHLGPKGHEAVAEAVLDAILRGGR